MHSAWILAAALAAAQPASPEEHQPKHPDAPPPAAASLTLEQVLARVAEANPDLAAADARTVAAVARARQAGRLPDPMARVQTWNTPGRRPFAVGESEMIMYGVEQGIPLPPKLALRRRVEGNMADAAQEARRATGNDVRRDATVAFVDYWRTWNEIADHRAHLTLTNQILATAESQYAAGVGRQSDVIRAGLEVSRLHAELHTAEQEMLTARARLSALMSVPIEEVAADPWLPDEPITPPPLALLEARVESGRPEVRMAEELARSAASARRLARTERWLPDVMVGASWMDSRMGDDGAMWMASLNLPFISPGRADAERAARADLKAARSARDSAVLGALAELRDAHARVESAAMVVRLHREEIVPRAERAVESTRAAYAGGNGGFTDLLHAAHERLLSHISRDRAVARHRQAVADLERAVGAPLDTLSTPSDAAGAER